MRASFTFLRSPLCDLSKVCEEREYQSDSEGGDEPDSPERISSRGAQQEEKEEEVQDVLGISTVLPLSKKVCSAGSQRLLLLYPFVLLVLQRSRCFSNYSSHCSRFAKPARNKQKENSLRIIQQNGIMCIDCVLTDW